MDHHQLEQFIVAAKAATYVGDGKTVAPSRPKSHDLAFEDGEWRYLDSYYGGTDFIGQEVVWHRDTPLWSMVYYGFITRPDLIDGLRAGATIKAALTAMYGEGRFLGGFEWVGPHGTYRDGSEGDLTHFRGREVISVDGVEAYALDYAGGLIKP